MPYFFFKEIIIFFNNPDQGFYIAAGTILATAAVIFPFFLADNGRDRNRKLLHTGIGAAILLIYAVCFGMFRSNGPVVLAITIFMVAALVASAYPFLSARNSYFPRRPLARPLAMYIIEAVVFSTYFVIFRSFESFRLPQQTMMQISVSFIIVLFILSSTLKSRFEFRKTPFNLPVLLLTLLSLFSFILSPNFMISFKEFIQFFFIVMNFYLIIHCLDARKHYNTLIILVIASMTIEALIGVGQHFGLNEYIRLGRNFDPFSTLGNKNYVAEMLAMAIPFSLAVSIGTNRKWLKALVWLCVTPMLFVVIVAITRGSWIGLIGSSLVFLFFAIDRLPRRKAFEAAAHIAGLLALVFIIVTITNNQVGFSLFGNEFIFRPPPYSYSSRLLSISNIIGDMLVKRPALWIIYIGIFFAFAGSAFFLLRRTTARSVSIGIVAAILTATAFIGLPDDSQKSAPAETPAQQQNQDVAPPQRVEDSIVSRTYIWGGSIEMVKHYPLGVGLGAFKIRYLDMLKSYLSESGKTTIPGLFKDVNAKEAHCEYLHLTAELGPLAPVLILFFAWTVVSFFLRVINANPDTFTLIVAIGSFSSIISLALSASLGFPFHIMGPAMLCGVYLAMLVFSHDRVFSVETPPLELPGYRGSRPIVMPRPQVQPSEPKKKKGKKKKKQQKEQKPPEEPDLSWQKHWRIVPLDLFLGLVLMLIAVAFFIFISVMSWNWQMSNIHMKTAKYMAQAGRTEQAADLFDKSLKLDRYNGDIHLFRGMFLQKQGKRDEALEEFLEAEKYYDLPQIALDKGAIYFEMGPAYYEQAQEAFKESLAVYPNYAHPRYNLGLISYQKALALSNDPSGNSNLLKHMDLEGVDRRQKALELFTSAATMFEQAIKLNPRLVTASFKLALTYEKMYALEPSEDRLKNSIRWYEHTIRLNPAHADAYYNLGLLYTKQESLVNQKAQVLTQQGQNEEAAKLREEAKNLNQKSQEYFSRSVQYNPKHTRALNNRGNQLFNEGKIEEALDMYQRAISIDPNYVNSQLNIALAYIHLRKFDDALVYLNKLKAQRLEPQHDIKVAYMLGTAHMSLGRQQLAGDILSAAVDKYKNSPYNKTPEYFSAAIRFGDVKNRLGQYEEAIEILEKVVSAGAPAFQEAEALLYIGQAHQRLGNNDKAGEYLRRLLETHPGSPYEAPAKQVLSNMGRN